MVDIINIKWITHNHTTRYNKKHTDNNINTIDNNTTNNNLKTNPN